MKYRVIKDFPSVFIADYKIGDIIDENNFGLFNKCKKFPEYFKEVKEPVFTTEDGIKLCIGDKYYYVLRKDHPLFPLVINYGNIGIIDETFGIKPLLGYKQFSTNEAAQDWINKNQKLYSKQDILDAIEYTDKSMRIGKNLWNKIFLEKLNINIE